MAHAFLIAGGAVQVQQRCTKKPYERRQDARRAMNRGIARRGHGMVAMGQGTMNVYRCGICRFWHLGHIPKGAK